MVGIATGLALGTLGYTHSCIDDVGILRSIPGISLAAPKDGNELRDLMYTGLNHWKGPFVVRYPKASSMVFDESLAPETVEVGTWEVLKEGNDLVILAVGSMVPEARHAIEKQNLDVQLVNARFVKPLDEKMLDEISRQFSMVITIEEGSLEGGFGQAVLYALYERNFENVF